MSIKPQPLCELNINFNPDLYAEMLFSQDKKYNLDPGYAGMHRLALYLTTLPEQDWCI